jgi:hypothetical protein
MMMLGLLAVQALHTWEWLRLSNRTAGVLASRVDSLHPEIDSILRDTSLVKSQRVFDFSLSPWNLPTLVFPTWAGSYQPANSRWVSAIPSEGRMWVPTLYAGIWPLLFVVLACRKSSGCELQRRFLCWLLVLSLLAAMGNYSVGWLWRNLMDSIGANAAGLWLGSDTKASLYGWLTLLPGYDAFRYPAKWLVFSTASLALLSGIGLDWIGGGRPISPNRLERLLVFARWFALGALWWSNQVWSKAGGQFGMHRQFQTHGQLTTAMWPQAKI